MLTSRWLGRALLLAVVASVWVSSLQSAYAQIIAPVGRCLYVSPTGTAEGDGSAEKPLDIVTAFSARSPVRPGQTILLQAGTYEGPIKNNSIERLPFVLALNGTKEQPILIMPAPDAMAPAATAHINGTLNISGSHLCVFALEIGDLTWDLLEEKRKNAAIVQIVSPSAGVRLINCNLFGGWNGVYGLQGTDNEFYGCLVHDFGNWKGHMSAGGSSFYTHNAPPNRKVISNCATYRTGALNIAPHGKTGQVSAFEITQNLIFLAGAVVPHNSYENLMINTQVEMDDVHVIGNVIYQHDIEKKNKANVRMSSFLKHLVHHRAEFKDNYVMGAPNALRVATWENFTATGNTIWAPKLLTEISSSTISDGIPTQEKKPDLANYTFKQNTYYGSPDELQFRYSNTEKDREIDNYNFSDWQKMGLDTDSKMLPLKDGKPTGNKTFVFANKYQAGRANVAVFNWDGQTDFEIDLQSVLKSGAKFSVYHMLDITQTIGQAKPVLSGVYDGKPVKFHAKKDESSPDFEAYLVLPVQ